MLAPAFNVFRLAGDLLHVISIILLWTKMQSTRSCAGISLKSQMLYMLVYVSRYLDLLHFTSFELAHFYNFIMKCLFLASQGAVIYYMMYRFRSTYIAKLDTVRVEFIIVPCLVLAYTFLDLRPGGGAFYVFNEVTSLQFVTQRCPYACNTLVFLDIFDPVRIRCHPPPNVPAQ